MDEAHVEHAIGFVQHQDFNVGQIDKALASQIEQAPGCGHQDVAAGLDARNLRVHAHAAKDDGGAQLKVFAVGADRFLDLRGQFARGRQHQGADAAGLGAGAAGQQLQHGQGEAGGLAGAGLGAGQQVVAFQHHGDGLRLYGGGLGVALLLHGPQNGGCQVQIIKVHRMDAPVSSGRRMLRACSGGRRPVKEAKSGFFLRWAPAGDEPRLPQRNAGFGG